MEHHTAVKMCSIKMCNIKCSVHDIKPPRSEQFTHDLSNTKHAFYGKKITKLEGKYNYLMPMKLLLMKNGCISCLIIFVGTTLDL